MKALTFQGVETVRCERVEEPSLRDGRDAIVEVDLPAICGSDLHVYHGREAGLDAQLRVTPIGTSTRRAQESGSAPRGRTRSAYDAVRRTLVASLDRLDVVPGFVSSIQTFGAFANFHPRSGSDSQPLRSGRCGAARSWLAIPGPATQLPAANRPRMSPSSC